MPILRNKKLAVMVLVVGIVSIGLGSFFLYQGFDKASLITETMKEEKITYSGADGEIVGVIDTAAEAGAMAEILKEHRMEQGIYTELDRTDPARQSILNAMVMENSLTLAQMGFGLTQVVEATGVFMILVGLAMGTGALVAVRQK